MLPLQLQALQLASQLSPGPIEQHQHHHEHQLQHGLSPAAVSPEQHAGRSCGSTMKSEKQKARQQISLLE